MSDESVSREEFKKTLREQHELHEFSTREIRRLYGREWGLREKAETERYALAVKLEAIARRVAHGHTAICKNSRVDRGLPCDCVLGDIRKILGSDISPEKRDDKGRADAAEADNVLLRGWLRNALDWIRNDNPSFEAGLKAAEEMLASPSPGAGLLAALEAYNDQLIDMMKWLMLETDPATWAMTTTMLPRSDLASGAIARLKGKIMAVREKVKTVLRAGSPPRA